MERIEVYLTPQQHKKLLHHEPFQLSAQQLKDSDKHIGKKFHVELQLSKAHYKKLLSNVKAGKGYRFTKEAILGGDLLGELWNGAKKAAGAVGSVVNKVGEYIPADMIRKGVKTGLTAGATALGTMVGNPELGLMAAPLIDKGVDYAEKGYNYFKSKKEPKDALQDAYETYAPRARQYVEDRIPATRRARELYDEYEPRVRKVYRKARKVYYQEPDDEEDDDEEDYAPPPPPRRRKPQYSAPAPSDYSGYGGRGLKKGSAEMKAKMAKLRAMRTVKGGAVMYQNATGQVGGKLKKGSAAAKAWGEKMKAMRKVKGGEIEDGKYFHARTTPMTPAETQAWLNSPNNPFKNSDNKVGYEPWNMPGAKSQGKGIGRRGRKKRVVGGWNPFNPDDWDPKKNGVADALDPNKNGVADAFDPNKNGVADAFDPNKNGVAKFVNEIGDSLRGAADNVVSFYQQAASTASPLVNAAIAEVAKNLPSDADAQAFGKQIASALIHQGIPQATAAICAALCEAALPEGGPVSAQLGSQLGKMLGDRIADEVGSQTGYGLRRRRGHRQLLRGGTLHEGVPYPHYTDQTLDRIRTHGLDFRHKGENGMYKGGSFAPLGGSVFN